MPKYIIEDVEIFSDESDEEDSDEEKFDGDENSDKMTMTKRIKIFCECHI